MCVRQFAMNNGFPLGGCALSTALGNDYFLWTGFVVPNSSENLRKYVSNIPHCLSVPSCQWLAHNFESFIRCTHGTKERRTRINFAQKSKCANISASLCFFRGVETHKKKESFWRSSEHFDPTIDGRKDDGQHRERIKRRENDEHQNQKYMRGCATRDRKSQTIKVD